MRITIHDVGHGGCAVVTGPYGHRMMLDCGRDLDRPWSPSVAYAGEEIQLLFLLNLDEDHVADLPGMTAWTNIKGILSNPSINAADLLAMKPQGMNPGVSKAYELLRLYKSGRIGRLENLPGGVSWHAFWNVHGVDFVDTNNLSLAVFVNYCGFTILFGGDMETAGWRQLLLRPSFVARLREVKVFVASHHGRDNGRCDELFENMRPDLVIISDGPKTYGTQETTDWYANRAGGIPDKTRKARGLLPPLRKVVTTRRDGAIVIDVETSGRYHVNPEQTVSSPDDYLKFLFNSPAPHLGSDGIVSALGGSFMDPPAKPKGVWDLLPPGTSFMDLK